MPRPYVTGESPESVLKDLEEAQDLLKGKRFSRPEEVVTFLREEVLSDGRSGSGTLGNTTKCALETSLLDATSRFFAIPMSELLGRTCHKAAGERIRYDGIIPQTSDAKTRMLALCYRLAGFRSVKLKVGKDPEEAIRKVALARQILGNSAGLRIDANGCWTPDTALFALRQMEPSRVAAVEQPLPGESLSETAALSRRVATPVILDESVCTMRQLTRTIDSKACAGINIRLSKCGGFLNSLAMVDRARAAGLGIQLGCMVGETGILAAAGRRLAQMIEPDFGLEGSYGRFLLRGSITERPPSIGLGGKATVREDPGSGIVVSRCKLSRWTSSGDP